MRLKTFGQYKPAAAAAIALTMLIGAQTAAAQVFQPPAPEEPSSALINPAPVGSGEIPIWESLPSSLPLAFFLTVAQTPVLGDWEISGEVLAVNENRTIEIQTGNDEQALLLYRLPGFEELRLRSGRPVSIVRTVAPQAVSWGWMVDITSENEFIASAARLFGEEPQAADVGGGIRVGQTGERIDVLAETDSETTHAIEAEVESNDETVGIAIGEQVELRFNDKLLKVELLSSMEVVPGEGSEDVAEGSRFTLEFAVTPVLGQN